MFKKKINHYLKLKTKDILKKFGLKIEKITNLETQLLKVNNIKNNNVKIKTIKSLIKRFPNSPKLHLYLIKCLHEEGDSEKFDHFEIFNKKRQQNIEDLGLSSLNLEFIWSGMVAGSLGNHYPLESLINAANLGLRKKKQLTILLSKKLNLRNNHFFKYFNEHINLIRDEDTINSLRAFANFLELPLGICIPLDSSCPSLDAASNITQSLKIKNNDNKPLFKLTDEDLEKGYNILHSIGVPKDAWYVTLHARELGYRGENLNNSSEDFRNTDLNTYNEAANFITNSGGWVFRMGDSSMKDINTNNKNLIDYANSKIKSEFMDVFLGATSKFCIGSSSGYYHIPFTFSVPVLFTNSPRFEEYYGLRKNDLYLPRMITKKNEKKPINLNFFTDTPQGIYNNKQSYLKDDLEYIPNSSEEIYASTVEIFKSIEKNNINNVNKKQGDFLKLARAKSDQYYKEFLTPLANISEYFINNLE
tara:strand:+ start:2212 stop:3636 length:1425 start_codon:yes stop_codon:yes gene_type:complete